jgi:hypothetical protein
MCIRYRTKEYRLAMQSVTGVFHGLGSFSEVAKLMRKISCANLLEKADCSHRPVTFAVLLKRK